MKKHWKWITLLLAGFVAMALSSCSDEVSDTPTIDDVDDDDAVEYVDNRPTTDEVNTTFDGKVAFLFSGNYDVVNYLSKRLANITNGLTDDADVVVMDESNAASIMADEAEYSVLKDLWDSNKIVAFLSPGRNAYALVNQLNSIGGQAVDDEPDADTLERLANVSVYATRADGTALYQDKLDATYEQDGATQFDVEGDGEPQPVLFAAQEDEEPVVNDYTQGAVGEGVAAWLKKNALTGEQPHVAFTRADDQYKVSSVSVTHNGQATVTHDWIKTRDSKATVPGATTVTTSIEMQIYGVYDSSTGSDWYDVNIKEAFPANKTFVKNVVVRKTGAYKYKYTGGCYEGPLVQLYLDNVPEESISLKEIAPLAQAGSYSKTHNPMQINLGASLTGNVSMPPGVSPGFSMGMTLPSTTVSFTHAEMPIDFSRDNNKPMWTYSTDYRVYKGQKGFNSKYRDVPDIVHSYCETDQAVTFVVSNSKSFGDKALKLSAHVRFYVRGELAMTWKTAWRKDHFTRDISTKLPRVNRYFEKYTPYPMPGYWEGDAGEWSNLQNLLKNNINYRALCDETLQVGAQTEKGLDATAKDIWNKALESLIKQYDGMKTKNEYVIGLARTDGSHIQLALHIKDGKWSKTEIK